MSSLADKLRRSRESQVEAGGFSFTIRRPTEMDWLEIRHERSPIAMARFVVGWDKVRELDLFPGGDPHPAAFDAEVCTEWLRDRSDLLLPLVDAIRESYDAHRRKLEDASKN